MSNKIIIFDNIEAKGQGQSYGEPDNEPCYYQI